MEPDKTLDTGIVEADFMVVHKDAIQALICSPKIPFYVSPSQILNERLRVMPQTCHLLVESSLERCGERFKSHSCCLQVPALRDSCLPLLQRHGPSYHFLTTSNMFQSQRFCTCCPPPTPEISSFRSLHGWSLTSFRFLHLSSASGLS